MSCVQHSFIHFCTLLNFFFQILDADKDLGDLVLDFEKRRTEILCGYA